MRSPWRKPPIANQDFSAARALLQEAKRRGYQVVEGSYMGESLFDGPVFILEGVQRVRAWFKVNGNPCFKLLT